jgi:hypothetical protein
MKGHMCCTMERTRVRYVYDTSYDEEIGHKEIREPEIVPSR